MCRGAKECSRRRHSEAWSACSWERHYLLDGKKSLEIIFGSVLICALQKKKRFLLKPEKCCFSKLCKPLRHKEPLYSVPWRGKSHFRQTPLHSQTGRAQQDRYWEGQDPGDGVWWISDGPQEELCGSKQVRSEWQVERPQASQSSRSERLAQGQTWNRPWGFAIILGATLQKAFSLMWIGGVESKRWGHLGHYSGRFPIWTDRLASWRN